MTLNGMLAKGRKRMEPGTVIRDAHEIRDLAGENLNAIERLSPEGEQSLAGAEGISAIVVRLKAIEERYKLICRDNAERDKYIQEVLAGGADTCSLDLNAMRRLNQRIKEIAKSVLKTIEEMPAATGAGSKGPRTVGKRAISQ